MIGVIQMMAEVMGLMMKIKEIIQASGPLRVTRTSTSVSHQRLPPITFSPKAKRQQAERKMSGKGLD